MLRYLLNFLKFILYFNLRGGVTSVQAELLEEADISRCQRLKVKLIIKYK